MPRDLDLARRRRLLWRAGLSLGLAVAVVGCGSDSGGAAVTATAPDAGATSPPPSTLWAGGDVVAWTEAYCGPDRGRTRVLDRRTGSVTELDQSLWVTVTPGGLIGAGEFGPSDLIDPRTWQYVAVLPPRAGGSGPAIDVNWSPDYKYASRGQAFGHGGYRG